MGIFKEKTPKEWIDVITDEKEYENYIEAISTAHAIDIISRTIAGTELQVFRGDKKIEETKDCVFYRLNIKPNINENGTNFKNKLVKQLILKGKALVIFEKKRNLTVDYMYLAKSYDCSDNINEGKVFKNIELEDEEGNTKQIDREYKLEKGECLYFSYENKQIYKKLEKYKNQTQKLLKVIDKSYKSANTNKWRLKNPSGQPTIMDSETGQPISYKDYTKKLTDGLFDEEESIVLLSQIFDLTLLNKDIKKDLTDHKNMEKEIGDKVAMSWNIPLDVFYGTKTEKSNGNNDLITFACNPIMKSIEDTLNGGLIGEEDFLKGEYIRFNRFCMQHLDITSLGTSLDKLTSIGFSYNQLCKMLNLPEIDEPWANEHHVTKNYANVKGGAEDGE